MSWLRPSPKRILRVLFLLIWLTLLLAPCLALYIASRGELRLRTGPAPEQEIRLWLVQDAQRAGMGLAYASERSSGNERCFQTEVQFLLWRGRQLDDDTATRFCACYAPDDSDFSAPRGKAGACAAGAANNDA